MLSLLPNAVEDEATLISEPLRRMVASLVLDTTSEGIWLIDAESRTTFVNQHTASLLGYSVAEMLGETLTTFMDDEGRKICEQNLERRRSGVEEQHEFRFVRKDGTVVWTLLATNPVYDRSGRYAGALAMVANLTEQKARERRLSDRVRELEQALASRAESPAPADATTGWLESLAAADPSAALGDRRYFAARVAAELSRKQASAPGSSVLLLTLDGCSSLAGQDAGERLLRAITAALSAEMGTPQGLLRSPDTLARFAHDGFAMLAANTSLQDAISLAERVLDVVREVTSTVASEGTRVSASIGVAAYPLHATNCAELLAAADGALREARRTRGGAIGIANIPRMRVFGAQGSPDLVVRSQSSRPSRPK